MSWSNDNAMSRGKSRNLTRLTRWVVGGGLALCAALTPRGAQACGGFFCSAANPVNQAAERIVFANNGDGTVTAVIEIQYQGPSESFSWLLPISSVPMGDEIAVASNAAFQRLQAATNPQYNLTTRVEGTCATRPQLGAAQDSGSFASPNASTGGSAAMGPGGVTVEAQGVVGSFEWTVISLDPALTDPADAAVEWLNQNDYDVPPGAPGLLGPYLDDGLNLLALKLQKGADAGSIRPLVLTYEAELPMIPIKLTAVAANEDMGVMTWLLGEARAVPKNYNALELNEARINWFNANLTYNDVVIEAADDAGGQGFVTELSAPTATLRDRVWSTFEESNWQSLRSQAEAGAQVYDQIASQYMGFDGFWESVEGHITLPAGTTFEQHRMCPFCTSYQVTMDSELPGLLETNVIEPMRVVQRLIDAHPQITRLYTTMSAAEMTVDPLFTYNPDLLAVSNIHTAERIIECSSSYYVEGAPWRIELPQGGVIRGGPEQVGSWPTDFDAQPANRRILRQSESGSGQVLEDNSTNIESSLGAYNQKVPRPPMLDDGGCSVGRGAGAASWLLAALGFGALLRRRRP
jgi:MYXO-CTERM domain-containing protein